MPMDELMALLQNHVLSPMLAIDDPRTSDRIDFIGGIRGTAELESLWMVVTTPAHYVPHQH